MIEARQVHRSYTLAKKEIEVLKGIDLAIEVGEKVFLCGPSGAGKTTLMYTLAGLEEPHRGKILIDEIDFYALSSGNQARLRNEKIGYIFQNYFLLPELTAIENVLVPGLIGGKADTQNAMSALERVGLSARVDHLPAELSGGEQQRVAIARALVNSPSIIFADEPTGNLDSANSDEIMNILMEVVAERNATLVVVTHDTNLSRHGDRIFTIKDGLIADE
ncbi:ABC transporter ATP-binding protein [bacterium]|jgi:ABC-type lipoprotein export system ATPase subunit|nr:ABC transporter ATP-binding protein [bacterium]|tara:strand:+ start:259 stop:918 length:660 start_codon:yes stop_codon:yes gene_type:complete